MVESVDSKSPPHRPIFLLRRRCGTYTLFGSVYSRVELSFVSSSSIDTLDSFVLLFFRGNRWNNDDEDERDDRKTDLGTTCEEQNRKRKSRWNGR